MAHDNSQDNSTSRVSMVSLSLIDLPQQDLPSEEMVHESVAGTSLSGGDRPHKKISHKKKPSITREIEIKPVGSELVFTEQSHNAQSHDAKQIIRSSPTGESAITLQSPPNKQLPNPKTKTSGEKLLKQPVREVELNSILVDACATAEKCKNYEKECAQLRAQVTDLKKALRESQDFVFSLQPQQNRITESEAAADYSSLYESVQDWVDTRLGDHINDRVIIKQARYVSVAPVKKFISYISVPGREMSRFQDTDEYNVVSAIMKFLCVKIFDNEFYCNFGDREIQFLRNIELSMSRLEPRRDISTVRRWRTETLTALTTFPGFISQRQRQNLVLVSELANMLSIFIPRNDRDDQIFASTIQRSIIEPALALAHKLHLSVDKFSFQWTALNKTRPESRTRDPNSYVDFECMDLMKSGKIMKMQAFQVARDITYLVDIAPALMLETAKADSFTEPKVVHKARIIVAARKDTDVPLMPPLFQEGESPTLLYWMLDKLQKIG